MQGQQRAVIAGGGIMGADIAAIFAAGGHAGDVVQRPGDPLRGRLEWRPGNAERGRRKQPA